MNTAAAQGQICIYYRKKHANYLGLHHLGSTYGGYQYAMITDIDLLKGLHIPLHEKLNSLRHSSPVLTAPSSNPIRSSKSTSKCNASEVSRCRALNSLSARLGSQIYENLSRDIGQYLDSGQFRFAFGIHIDDSISHIFASECFRRNIPYYSFSPSFVPGRTECLEGPWSELSNLNISPVSSADIQNLVQVFSRRAESYHWGWKPSFSRTRYFTEVLRSAMRNVVYTSQYFASSKSLYGSLASIHSAKPTLSYVLADLYRSHNATFDTLPTSRYSLSCYVPLPFLPEGSTDYWVPNLDSSVFYAYLLHCIDSNPDLLFVVKPHPAMHGITPSSVVVELSRRQNVYLLHPSVASSSVFRAVDFVYVGRGSTVLEAFFNNIPIVTYSNAYHIDLLTGIYPYHDFCSSISLARVFVERYSSFAGEYSATDKEQVAYRLLSSSSDLPLGSSELYSVFLDSLACVETS
jgi:hypothetical protein